jgi:uncharacterized 2Fe-2S/4Fe-4S cluster protein (DUF4445 family)
MRASRGAIAQVEISPEGVRYRTVGDAPPQGLCGSGLIDAIAGLFRAGYIDRAGRLRPDAKLVRERAGELAFVLVPAGEAPREIVITQRDIENALRAKAAIYAGVSILLRELDVRTQDLSRIYLAGAFGSHLNLRNAVTLGLIPDVPLERVHFLGNTALAGAKLALLSRAAWEEAQRIAAGVTYYDLISCPYYYDEFMAAKFLPHTDLARFPTVRGTLRLGEPV